MKVFTPSRENIPFFKKFINLLVFYGFNTIMIEVGGAMEYKSHPEINAGWVSYCKEMAEYSGKTTVIQDQTYPWYKNAIHMENGGGEYLSWEEMRQLVDYCKERQMDVIPEVPSLGHCDYLMMGNPDIAERTEDPYPDTYCPSNPRSYEILFDVMDEILEIFKPKRVNIGHDEYYSIAVCEKCRLKSGAEIFAGDVNKIAAYLKERNVKTVIWGDKLLRNAVVPDAGPFGGAEIKMYSPAFHMYLLELCRQPGRLFTGWTRKWRFCTGIGGFPGNWRMSCWMRAFLYAMEILTVTCSQIGRNAKKRFTVP